MNVNIKSDMLPGGAILALLAGMNKQYLIMDAVYSDETANFVTPSSPSCTEPVTIKIRTAKDNADAVFLHALDNSFPLTKLSTDDMFDYYSHTFDRLECILTYFFSIQKGENTYYYNNRGLYRDIDTHYNFRVIPGLTTPTWAHGAVMYQIYTDRFYNGDPSNDVVNNEYAYLSKAAKKIERWNQPVAADDVCNFYGGDLKGVIMKMDYLKMLGVECIYFTPLFVSPSNHKYDIQDYDYVDPHLGVIVEDGGQPLVFEKFHNKYATKYMHRTTNKKNLEASNELLCELIETAHKNGIRVILDGVFNHCGAFNKWLDKENFYQSHGYPPGAYREEASPYHNFFYWYDSNWPNNDCYSGWWGHDNHPKLNYENSKELYEYILNIGRKWVSPPYNADGWRLDVASDLGGSPEFNHKFWHDFRNAVREVNPEAIVIAEHYGDASDWLFHGEWDSIMNYSAFMEPVTWFLTGMQKHSDEFRQDMLNNAAAFENAIRYYNSRMTIQSRQMAMNQLSNHDHSRFLTRTNMKVGRLHTTGCAEADTGTNVSVMLSAVLLQMTWPGAPAIYYGDEAGLTGWTDPDNRRTYPWGGENKTLIDFHREMIHIRQSYSALKTGSLQFLHKDYGVLSYGRWDTNDKAVIVVNNNSYEKNILIPVWQMGIGKYAYLDTLIITYDDTFKIGDNRYQASNGYIKLTLPSRSGIVLVASK